MDWDGRNRRAWHRWPVTMDAHVEHGGVQVEAVIRDISRGGLFLEAPLSLELGQEVRILRPRLLASTTMRVCRRSVGEDGKTGWGLAFVGQGPMPGTPS